MLIRNTIVAGAAALFMAASSTVAFAQATGTENNATSGSSAGSGPNSGADVKGQTRGMSGATDGSSSSMEMKDDQKTSAGTSNNQVKDLRGHSETPTTGK